MRSYPISLDEDRLRALLVESEASYAQRRPYRDDPEHARRPEYFRTFAEEETRLAELSYAFEKPDATVRKHLGEAAGDWATVPKLGTALDPTRYLRALSAAIVAGDRSIRSDLAGMNRGSYTNPNITADELVYLMAEQLGALARGDSDAAGSLTPAIEHRARAKGVPQAALRALEPLRRLAAAVAWRDAEALSVAVGQREKFDRDRQAKEPHVPRWLLDTEALALLRLAREAGLTPRTDSVYLPLSLIEG